MDGPLFTSRLCLGSTGYRSVHCGFNGLGLMEVSIVVLMAWGLWSLQGTSGNKSQRTSVNKARVQSDDFTDPVEQESILCQCLWSESLKLRLEAKREVTFDCGQVKKTSSEILVWNIAGARCMSMP